MYVTHIYNNLQEKEFGVREIDENAYFEFYQWIKNIFSNSLKFLFYLYISLNSTSY